MKRFKLMVVLLCVAAFGAISCATLPKAQRVIDATVVKGAEAFVVGKEAARSYWLHQEWHLDIPDEAGVVQILRGNKAQKDILVYLKENGVKESYPVDKDASPVSEEDVIETLEGELNVVVGNETIQDLFELFGFLGQPNTITILPTFEFTTRDLEIILIKRGVDISEAQKVTKDIHNIIDIDAPLQTVAGIRDEVTFTIMLKYMYGYAKGLQEVLPRSPGS